jgi:hypothetical protein
MLDDITLIRNYLRQEPTLLSNPQLRVETASPQAVQLLTHHGQLLATADFTHLPPRIKIRPRSNYETLLHEMLIAHQFLPQGPCEGGGFPCYSYHPIPDGYTLQVTPALDFWKQWWGRYRTRLPQQRGGQQMDLLVFTQHQWYPVQDVISDRGTLFIKTTVGETAHTSADQLVWLVKAEPVAEEDKTQFFFPQTAAEKAQIQFQSRRPQFSSARRPGAQPCTGSATRPQTCPPGRDCCRAGQSASHCPLPPGQALYPNAPGLFSDRGRQLEIRSSSCERVTGRDSRLPKKSAYRPPALRVLRGADVLKP